MKNLIEPGKCYKVVSVPEGVNAEIFLGFKVYILKKTKGGFFHGLLCDDDGDVSGIHQAAFRVEDLVALN